MTKKKICSIFAVTVFMQVLLFSVLSYTAAATGFVDDRAGLLTKEQPELLNMLISKINEEQDITLAVVTVDSLSGKTAAEYADDYFDTRYPDEKDGAVLLISMRPRNWYISTTGRCIGSLSDAEIKSIGNLINSDLTNGDYYEGMKTFIERAETLTRNYGKTRVYKNVLAAVLTALAIGLITIRVKAYNMNTLRKQTNANSYEKNFSLTGQRDFYLYSHVSSRRIQTENRSSGTHKSAGGKTHGGGGGTF